MMLKNEKNQLNKQMKTRGVNENSFSDEEDGMTDEVKMAMELSKKEA